MSKDQRFDVYLSHNSCDRPAVKEIGERLKAHGLRVFLDEWELRPGLPWQRELSKAVEVSKTVAVFIGESGLGDWQSPEVDAFIDRSTREELPVIPVLLPKALREPKLDTFLKAFTWVDLRQGIRDEDIDRLMWGITGERPGDESPTETAGPGTRPPALHNLPLDSLGSLFHGRDEHLRQLVHELDVAPATALTQKQTIHGLGGIGKTRLAVEYAWRSGGRYSAVFFVTADSPAALHRGLAALATPSLINLELEAEAEVEEHVLRWLQRTPGWLLILDNVDSEDAVVAVRHLLPRLPGHVLITSRLSSWPGIPNLDIGKIKVEDAVLYLLERTAGRRQSCPEDEELANRLAGEFLDGLPLALEQAAAYIAAQGLSFREYLDIWKQDRGCLLEWFDRLELPDYPDSIAVAWKRNFEQLTPSAKALLRLIAHLAADPFPVAILTQGERTLAKAVALLQPRFGVVFECLARLTKRLAGRLDSRDFLNELVYSALVYLRPLRIFKKPVRIQGALTELMRYSLISRRGNKVIAHRMVQEVVRHHIPVPHRREWTRLTAQLIADFARGAAADRQIWHDWDQLRPHVACVTELADSRGITLPTFTLMYHLGSFLMWRGFYDEADPVLRRALEIAESAVGPDHAAVGHVLNYRGRLLAEKGRLEEAVEMLSRTILIYEDAFGIDHPAVAGTLINLLQTVDYPAENMEYLVRRNVELCETAFGPADKRVGIALANLAVFLKDTNRPDEAEQIFRHALEVVETACGPHDPDLASILVSLAKLLFGMNRFEEAEPMFRRALDFETRFYGTHHPRTQNIQRDLDILVKALEEDVSDP